MVELELFLWSQQRPPGRGTRAAPSVDFSRLAGALRAGSSRPPSAPSAHSSSRESWTFGTESCLVVEWSSDICGWDLGGWECLEDFSLEKAWWTWTVNTQYYRAWNVKTWVRLLAECDVNFNILIRQQTLMGEFYGSLSILNFNSIKQYGKQKIFFFSNKIQELEERKLDG